MTEFSTAFQDRPNILGSIKEVIDNVFKMEKLAEPVTRKYDNPNDLMKAMSKAFCIKIKRDKTVTQNKRVLATATQYFCYQCKLMFRKKYSLEDIGNAIGGDYHHTSVLHSIQTGRDRLETREIEIMELHEKWIKFNS